MINNFLGLMNSNVLSGLIRLKGTKISVLTANLSLLFLIYFILTPTAY